VFWYITFVIQCHSFLFVPYLCQLPCSFCLMLKEYLSLKDTVSTPEDNLTVQKRIFGKETVLKDNLDSHIVDFVSLTPFKSCLSEHNSCHSSPKPFRNLFKESSCRCGVVKNLVLGCHCDCVQFIVFTDCESGRSTKVYQGYLWEGSCWTDFGDQEGNTAFLISSSASSTYCVYCSVRGLFKDSESFLNILRKDFTKTSNKFSFIGDLSSLNGWRFPHHQVEEISSFILKSTAL
jgi:hypothetical protein